MRVSGAVILLVCALSLPLAVTAEIWRWQDAQGGTHYGDGPPPPDAVDPVRMPEPRAVDPAEATAARQRAARLARNQALEARVRAERVAREASAGAAAAALASKAAQRCAQARHNVRVFTRGAPVYLPDDRGGRRFLDDAERAERLAAAEAALVDCGDAQ